MFFLARALPEAHVVEADAVIALRDSDRASVTFRCGLRWREEGSWRAIPDPKALDKPLCGGCSQTESDRA